MAEDYLFPKAVDVKNMSNKHKEAVENHLRERPEDWVVELKYDGCALVVDIDSSGNYRTSSAIGKPVHSCNHIAEALVVAGIRDARIVGEVVDVLATSQQEISGMFRSGSNQPSLSLVIFDFHETSQEYAPGLLWQQIVRASNSCFVIDYADTVPHTTENGKNYIRTFEHLQEIANKMTFPYDGVILRKRNALWEEGRSKNSVIKFKPIASNTYDLLVLAYEKAKGEKTGRTTGTLMCQWKGDKLLRVSTGLSYEEQQNVELFVGKIVEVAGMGLTRDGMLREPRFHCVREDKSSPDY